MKTQNTKLGFAKSAIVELNDKDMLDVNAGASISIYIGRDDETQLEIDVTIFW
ncbi:hypothetical protein N7U66_12765 [Lacinutrix neustonica]|uniref:Uncharacterized protein n=1 Tax=Lacinutrix neustonica TaxID=2980107 RepID=A0A9E8MUT8_9FLAO|nr:hypothetical protein [Lacinutrix neustonica]WAC01047.1 hypothetical protein N7U66_12765 [Lacinutrix neustonica]